MDNQFVCVIEIELDELYWRHYEKDETEAKKFLVSSMFPCRLQLNVVKHAHKLLKANCCELNVSKAWVLEIEKNLAGSEKFNQTSSTAVQRWWLIKHEWLKRWLTNRYTPTAICIDETTSNLHTTVVFVGWCVGEKAREKNSFINLLLNTTILRCAGAGEQVLPFYKIW